MKQISEKFKLANLNKKRCTKCNEIKNLDQFWKSKQGFLNRSSRCNVCSQNYDKKFYLNRRNRDKKEESKIYRKNYILKNKDWWKLYEREYRNKRRKTDLFFRIKGNLSTRLSGIIKGNKDYSTLELIGCSRNKFLKYVESKFKPGMTWENYGLKGWHIDHIIPISNFNLIEKEEIKKACHYTNLQPLWWYENLEKSNKYEK